MALAETLQHLAADSSVGFTPGSFKKLGDARRLLPAGTTVRVGWASDKVTPEKMLAAAGGLRAQGMQPFVLFPARRQASEDQARDFLQRLVNEAGVADILLVAGDREPPVGPFRDSLDVLASGILEDVGLQRVGIAVHPGGHPVADDAALRRALREKAAWSQRTGIPIRARSQVVFDVGAVPAWAHNVLWREVPGLPLELGIPGPVAADKLVAYAHRIGGDLAVAEVRRGTAIDPDAPAGNYDPGAAAVTLANWLAREPDAPLVGLMVNQFDQLSPSAAWLAALKRGTFTVTDATVSPVPA